MATEEQTPLLPLVDVVEGVRAAVEATVLAVPDLGIPVRTALLHWLCNEPLQDEIVQPLCQTVLARARWEAVPPHAPNPPYKHADLRWSLAQYTLRAVRVLGGAFYGRDPEECHALASKELLPNILFVARYLQLTKRPCLLDQILPLLAFFHKHKDYAPFASMFKIPLKKEKHAHLFAQLGHDMPPPELP